MTHGSSYTNHINGNRCVCLSVCQSVCLFIGGGGGGGGDGGGGGGGSDGGGGGGGSDGGGGGGGGDGGGGVCVCVRARVCERQFLCQIAVGALKSVHKCIPTRDVPAPVCLSVERTATAEQVLQQGRNSLFPGDNGEFLLGNAKTRRYLV